jgi:FimV-like protein
MDPIMIGIAAVVILVIVAGVFLMKKGKSQTTVDTQTQVKRPKTLAEQQRELELQRQSQMPSPVAPDLPQTTLQTVQTLNTAESAQHELQAAEQLIQTQDYDGAITTLRRALKNHPSHSGLNFTLLNSYALAKDYQHFNTFYPEVLALNDADLTTQANNLKMLVDEEQSINARSAAMTHTAEAVESDGLDFDLPGFKQDSDKPVINSTLQVAMRSVTEVAQPASLTNGVNSKPDSELDFDFTLDVPETKIAPVSTATEPTIEITAAQSQSNELTFDDFDFDLPSKEPATAETVAASALESTTEIFAPIDEPVATTLASNVHNEAISDSDFDFDFSLPETQSTPTATAVEPMITTPTAARSADNNIADDFDFDFELNAEPAVTPTNDATTEADLIFDASDTKASSNLTSDAVTSVPVASDEATDIASFDLDDELLLQAEAATLATAATPSVAEPVVDLAEVSAPSQSDTLLISDDMFDFALDDDTTKDQDATSNVLVTEPTPSDDLIDLSFDDTATQANTQTTTTPTANLETPSIADEGSPTAAPVVEDLSAILDVIKDIDTDTLNVDLAEQYVNLGEYDSAKRLLDEIKDSNNTALVERAVALRQRIA